MTEAQRWPAIRWVLARRAVVCGSAAAAVVLLGLWLAWRTGWPELVPIAAIAAAALFGVLRVAIEVVSLVAETLMPQ